MATGYLDRYGAGEERRENLVRNSILIAVAALVVGLLSWYTFRNFHQARVAKRFLAAVQQQDYKGAYSLWGCATPQACPGYSYEKFLEDWGPRSEAGSNSGLKLTDTEGCGSGVILSVRRGSAPTKLWMEKSADTLSFSPVNTCPGKGPWAIMLHRTVGRLRQIYY